MIQIAITIEDPAWHELSADIEIVCQQALSAAWTVVGRVDQSAITDPWVSLLLADDDQLQALNLQFRGQDKPTNVLSFPSSQVDTPGDAEPQILGDIAVSRQTLVREAAEQEKDIIHHVTHLLVHGLLHLLGYDHEVDEDATAMEKLEIDILGEMKIPNPYD